MLTSLPTIGLLIVAGKKFNIGTYFSSLLSTILILFFKGRCFSGMENQVFLPIMTTFCFPVKCKIYLMWLCSDA